MSPEQLRGGKTYPSTDLYGLGATLIYLLTGEHPSELPQKRLKIDFRNLVKISADFRDWIDKLIEPNYQNRLPSAQAALNVLEGKSKLQDNLTFQLEKPSYSSIKLIKNVDKLIINIPSALNRKRYNYSLALLGVGWYAIIFLILLIFSISIYNIYWKFLWFIYFIEILSQVLLLNRTNRILVFRGLKAFKPPMLFIVFIVFITNVSYDFFVSIKIIVSTFILIVSSFILVAEMIWGGFFIKLMRELLFDTVLEIKCDNKIHIQQKLGFFLKQNEDIKLDDPITIIKNDFGRLLTRGERQWLIQQITTFQKNQHI